MKAKESHSETQETRFDYDCSPHCSLHTEIFEFILLYQTTKLWNSKYQTTSSEGYLFI